MAWCKYRPLRGLQVFQKILALFLQEIRDNVLLMADDHLACSSFSELLRIAASSSILGFAFVGSDAARLPRFQVLDSNSSARSAIYKSGFKVIRTSISFNFFRNIVALQIEIHFCTYYHLRKEDVAL